MKKLVKSNQRHKAFIGAAIGAVSNIAGGLIGAAKRRRQEKQMLEQQQSEQNRADALQAAQSMSASIADQSYVEDYKNKVVLKMGGKRKNNSAKFINRIERDKNNYKTISNYRKKAELGSIRENINDAAGGVSSLVGSLFQSSKAPATVKKSEGFSTSAPKTGIKQPNFQNTSNMPQPMNTNTNIIPNNPNLDVNNQQLVNRDNRFKCGGKKRMK